MISQKAYSKNKNKLVYFASLASSKSMYVMTALLRTYRKGYRVRWIPYDEYSLREVNVLNHNYQGI